MNIFMKKQRIDLPSNEWNANTRETVAEKENHVLEPNEKTTTILFAAS